MAMGAALSVVAAGRWHALHAAGVVQQCQLLLDSQSNRALLRHGIIWDGSYMLVNGRSQTHAQGSKLDAVSYLLLHEFGLIVAASPMSLRLANYESL